MESVEKGNCVFGVKYVNQVNRLYFSLKRVRFLSSISIYVDILGNEVNLWICVFYLKGFQQMDKVNPKLIFVIGGLEP